MSQSWAIINEIMSATVTVDLHLPQPNESRASYFKRVFKSIEHTANMRHFDVYEKIINNICDLSVSWKLPNLPKVVGRHNCVVQLRSVCKAIPDYTVRYDEPLIHHRLIVSHGSSEGTLTRLPDRNEHLWNFLNYGFYDDFDDQFVEQMVKYSQLKREKKSVRFISQFTVHLILDESLQYIEKIVTIRRGHLQIYEGAPLTDV